MPEGGCILRNQLQTEMKTSKHSDEANVYELLMFGGTVKLAKVINIGKCSTIKRLLILD